MRNYNIQRNFPEQKEIPRNEVGNHFVSILNFDIANHLPSSLKKVKRKNVEPERGVINITVRNSAQIIACNNAKLEAQMRKCA